MLNQEKGIVKLVGEIRGILKPLPSPAQQQS